MISQEPFGALRSVTARCFWVVFFFTFHALSFERNVFFDRTCPLKRGLKNDDECKIGSSQPTLIKTIITTQSLTIIAETINIISKIILKWYFSFHSNNSLPKSEFKYVALLLQCEKFK